MTKLEKLLDKIENIKTGIEWDVLGQIREIQYLAKSVRRGMKRMISGPKGPISELTEEESNILNMDMSSSFYQNCKRQRKREAKLCQSCPFRPIIERVERDRHGMSNM